MFRCNICDLVGVAINPLREDIAIIVPFVFSKYGKENLVPYIAPKKLILRVFENFYINIFK